MKGDAKTLKSTVCAVAERVGFEPTVRFPVRSLSRRVLSTAQSPLRGCCKFNPSKCSVLRQSSLNKAATAAISNHNLRNYFSTKGLRQSLKLEDVPESGATDEDR